MHTSTTQKAKVLIFIDKKKDETRLTCVQFQYTLAMLKEKELKVYSIYTTFFFLTATVTVNQCSHARDCSQMKDYN